MLKLFKALLVIGRCKGDGIDFEVCPSQLYRIFIINRCFPLFPNAVCGVVASNNFFCVPDRAKSLSSHEFNDIEQATLVAFDGYSAGYDDLTSSLSRPLSQRHLIALKISFLSQLISVIR
ncbi:hypothetical protein QTO02_04690 [Vibrio fortis]